MIPLPDSDSLCWSVGFSQFGEHPLARFRPTPGPQDGLLRRVDNGLVSTDSLDAASLTMRPSAGTTTVRSCISRRWLEVTSEMS